MSGSSSSSDSEGEEGGAFSLFGANSSSRGQRVAHKAATAGGKRPRDEPTGFDAAGSGSDSDSDASAGAAGAGGGAGAAGEAHRFDGLGLSTWLVKACTSMGLARPTPVQQACIPATLKGQDILACSPTGSGKTAAFALPVLEHLSRDPYGIFAVVLTAGRELAQQITDQFNAFGRPMNVRVCTVIGGMDFTRQARELAATPHIVVATPGRLADHLSSGASQLKLRHVQYVVIDEADRLLDASMAPDLDVIFGAMPPAAKRHTLMFSATMTKNLHRLEALAVHSPFKWSLDDTPTTVSALSQYYVLVARPAKMSYLAHIMRTQGPLADQQEQAVDDAGDVGQRARSCIVFVSTRYSAQLLMETLTELGVHCVALHSALSQKRRLAALGKFKSGIVQVMVATDVASRGLDIPQVELVVNFDVTRNPDDYIHRVGRTARAGRGGRAITFVSQYDIELVLAIEGVTGVKMVQLPGVDEEAVLAAMGKVTTARQMAKLRLAETGFEQKIADEKARKAEQRDKQLEYLEGDDADAGADGSSNDDDGNADDHGSSSSIADATATPAHTVTTPHRGSGTTTAATTGAAGRHKRRRLAKSPQGGRADAASSGASAKTPKPSRKAQKKQAKSARKGKAKGKGKGKHSGQQ